MATKDKSADPEIGFAAFLDLRDSTYVWNLNPDLAEEALALLSKTVEGTTKGWQGRIGNFTGDGFLVLFPTAEHAIRGLAAVIDEWEPQRLALFKSLARRRSQPPDECSLMVRTGVAHGHYRFFKLLSRSDVAGESINRASRCKAESKPFFASAGIEPALAKQQRVFVTLAVYNLIRTRADYWSSENLPVEFKGYERPSTGGLLTTPEHIVAVWPKLPASAKEVTAASLHNLQAATDASSRVDVADRLVASAAVTAIAPTRPAWDALQAAILSYQEALAMLPERDLLPQRAEIHGKLGLALAALVELLSPSERRERLDESLNEFKSALGLITKESEPESFGACSFNIAAIRRRQAELVPPAERAYYLTEAVRHLRNVLQISRYVADTTRHSVALGTLALVIGDQAEFLGDEAKQAKWAEAVDVLRQALAVTTPAASPHHYASVQSDLSNALRMEAREVDSRPGRQALLADGETMARAAAKALDAGATPSRYANAQVNLGLILLDRAQLTNRTEAMLMLAEAADAFKEALKVNDAREYWHKRATVLENLSLALQLQASLLGGSDRAHHLSEARRTSEQALRIYREIGYVESAEKLEKAIEKLEGTLA
jgi:class 3 adenylate cyclase